MAATNSPGDAKARMWLAIGLTGTGVILIGAVSAVAIIFASDASRPEMARLVFASVLPLVGTWIGTVLAFYFARENLQTASQATLETLKLAGTLSEDTLVTDAMTPVAKIKPVRRVADKTAAGALKLKALHSAMEATENSRVPVINDSGVALMVIHEPEINTYAQRKPVQVTGLGDDDTVAELRSVPALRRAVDTFVAVAQTATLAEARREMLTSPECKDVFVTENGKVGGKVVGWLTNSDLARSN